MTYHKATFFKPYKDDKVKCTACHVGCVIGEKKNGICGIRRNINGKLVLIAYGKTMSMQIDPIEKKPFFHFKPNSKCVGVSTIGCNFKCAYCQNYDLSQTRVEEALNNIPTVSPEQIVNYAKENCDGIAYTYNEPTIFVEYALDIMKLAKKNNLYNAWVSNGYMSNEVREEIKPSLNAINIDLKGASEFYKKLVGPINVEKVRENIEWFYENKVHLEVTNLIIPNYNDSNESISEIIDFLLTVSNKIPIHFSAFFPMHKLTNVSPTSQKQIFNARDIALEKGMKYVYVGNLREDFQSTNCPNCNSEIIKRQNYVLEWKQEKANKCQKCNAKIDLIL